MLLVRVSIRTILRIRVMGHITGSLGKVNVENRSSSWLSAYSYS